VVVAAIDPEPVTVYTLGPLSAKVNVHAPIATTLVVITALPPLHIVVGAAPVTVAVTTTGLTVTVVEQVAIFPVASVAVKVTVVEPKGKIAGALLVITNAQLSLATGVVKTTPVAVQFGLLAVTTTGG
jgi:hypothetical protein